MSQTKPEGLLVQLAGIGIIVHGGVEATLPMNVVEILFGLALLWFARPKVDRKGGALR